MAARRNSATAKKRMVLVLGARMERANFQLMAKMLDAQTQWCEAMMTDLQLRGNPTVRATAVFGKFMCLASLSVKYAGSATARMRQECDRKRRAFAFSERESSLTRSGWNRLNRRDVLRMATIPVLRVRDDSRSIFAGHNLSVFDFLADLAYYT